MTRLKRPTRSRLREVIAGLRGCTAPPPGAIGLVVDADRTLAPQDTGRLVGRATGVDEAIRSVFESHGYTEEAFSLVAEVWSGVPIGQYLAEAQLAAAAVTPHAGWEQILRSSAGRVPVVVITAGIPQSWRWVLDRLGLTEVLVIGGCRRGHDDFIVCPETKAELVDLLQEAGLTVVAAGDSTIDLPMLTIADFPLFVPDHKGSPALREKLSPISRVKHLATDGRRFDGLETWTFDDLNALILERESPSARRQDK